VSLPRTIGPDDPLPLSEAVAQFYPCGGIKVATLLSAIRQGKLGHEKQGRAYFVTRRDIEAWRKACRVPPKAPASTCASEKDASRSGSSETGNESSALAAAKAISAGLKKRSRGISRSVSRQTPANVISIGSRSRKSSPSTVPKSHRTEHPPS
jgi:hypothetical protein